MWEGGASSNLSVLIINVLPTFLIAPSLRSSLLLLFSLGAKNNQLLFVSVNISFIIFALEEIIISIVAWRWWPIEEE